MKITEVVIQDGKLCAQLLNFLKIAKVPEGTSVNDCIALNDSLKWFNELVKGIAMELQKNSGGSAKASVSPMPILPIKKQELAKYKKKAKK